MTSQTKAASSTGWMDLQGSNWWITNATGNSDTYSAFNTYDAFSSTGVFTALGTGYYIMMAQVHL